MTTLGYFRNFWDIMIIMMVTSGHIVSSYRRGAAGFPKPLTLFQRRFRPVNCNDSARYMNMKVNVNLNVMLMMLLMMLMMLMMMMMMMMLMMMLMLLMLMLEMDSTHIKRKTDIDRHILRALVSELSTHNRPAMRSGDVQSRGRRQDASHEPAVRGGQTLVTCQEV